MYYLSFNVDNDIYDGVLIGIVNGLLVCFKHTNKAS